MIKFTFMNIEFTRSINTLIAKILICLFEFKIKQIFEDMNNIKSNELLPKFLCGPLFLLCPISELKQRYNITAVPKLVIVKENGDVITDKGRKQIRDRGLACFGSWLDAAEVFQNFKG